MNKSQSPDPVLSPAAPRIALLDIARGIAIIAMVIYHFTWDLRFYEFITLDVTAEPGWIAFQKLIVGSFVFLSGVSLFLAHQGDIRWRSYGRRFAMLAGAAVLVSAGTYFFSPEAFVFFGVLHALALFSLLGLAAMRMPVIALLGLGVVILVVPMLVSSPLFASRWLAWIGLFDTPPLSEDLVPFFPWFGVFLLGMAGARLLLQSGLIARLAGIAPGAVGSALALMGRWSLVIYLIHQPLLLGALYPVALLVQPQDTFREAQFLQSCEAQCYASSGYGDFCTAYCACTLERVEADDLWAMLEQPQHSPQEEAAMAQLASQCTAEVLDLQ